MTMWDSVGGPCTIKMKEFSVYKLKHIYKTKVLCSCSEENKKQWILNFSDALSLVQEIKCPKDYLSFKKQANWKTKKGI